MIDLLYIYIFFFKKKPRPHVPSKTNHVISKIQNNEPISPGRAPIIRTMFELVSILIHNIIKENNDFFY